MLKSSVWKNTRGLLGWVTLNMATGNTKRFKNMDKLKFDNLALRTLPIDPQKEIYPRQVPGACFSRVKPTPLDNPQLVAVSPSALELLDIDATEAVKENRFLNYFSGNQLIPGSEPAAHCYCGHQFGSFAGQLGDGATMYLGEVVNNKGERWELQFKGAGLTPYSRSADGRKVLRSSIREFLCSEAMHHLGIPTTRAGTCVTSDSRVVRDIFYDGHPKRERCTVITRIAPTFLRFGSFEIFKAPDSETGRKGPSHGRNDILQSLVDYSISTFYPEIDKSYDDRHQKILAFFTEVVRRTANLVAHWQSVGFCHGVLNTDNMSIVGLTIDYGPYGFMDRFDPDFICNASDDGGRYTYSKQPEICKWNLNKLAEALQNAVPARETKKIVAEVYDDAYKQYYNQLMSKKFGLISGRIEPELITSFLDTMYNTGSDFSNSFRMLHHMTYPSSKDFEKSKLETLNKLLSQCCTVEEMQKGLRSKMDPRQFQMLVMLAQNQPTFLTMMGMEGKLKAELERQKKSEEVKSLAPEVKREKDKELWKTWLLKYEEALNADMATIQKEKRLSTEEASKLRQQIMHASNPRFILRNWVAQNAIAKAEEGNFNEVKNVLHLLQNPYGKEEPQHLTESFVQKDTTQLEGVYKSCSGQNYDASPPEWSCELRVT